MGTREHCLDAQPRRAGAPARRGPERRAEALRVALYLIVLQRLVVVVVVCVCVG